MRTAIVILSAAAALLVSAPLQADPTTEFASAPRPIVSLGAYLQLAQAVADQATLMREGGPLFAKNCAECHGAQGQGGLGPKLAGTFRPVFKCKGFWEINRQQVTVPPGKFKRVQLGNGREAEIDLTSAKERRVAAFQDGKLVDRTVMPQGDGMTIIGGSREDKSVWFIVVRRDKPPD